MRTWSKQPHPTASIYLSDDGWRIEGLKRSDRGDRDWLLTRPDGRPARRDRPFRTLTAVKAWVDQSAKGNTP